MRDSYWTARCTSTTSCGTWLRCTRSGKSRSCSLATACDDVALVDPDLHTDATESGSSFVEAVINISAQRMQWHATFTIELRATHFSATETTRAVDSDALSARLHSGLHRFAHCATERNTARKLLGYTLCNELCIDLWVLYFENVELNLLARHLLKIRTNAVSLLATTTNDNAGACGVNVDANAIASALDFHARDTSALHTLRHHATNSNIFSDVILIELVCIPTRLELSSNAKAEPIRVNFLTH